MPLSRSATFRLPIESPDQKIVGNSFQPIGDLITGNYSPRLQAESYSERYWPDRQHTIS